MFLLTSNAYALIDCPSDQSQRFHNCFGTFNASNGDKYVGEWRDGKQQGQGTYTYANGKKYVGEWRDGKQQGQGTYTYADGREYVGEWQDYKRHGQGTYTSADGRTWSGIWENNKYFGTKAEWDAKEKELKAKAERAKERDEEEAKERAKERARKKATGEKESDLSTVRFFARELRGGTPGLYYNRDWWGGGRRIEQYNTCVQIMSRYAVINVVKQVCVEETGVD